MLVQPTIQNMKLTYFIVNYNTDKIKKHELGVVAADTKVEEDITPEVTRGFGLRERNERENKVVKFCQEEKFLIKI